VKTLRGFVCIAFAGLAIGGIAPTPADATFPGRNGKILYTWFGSGKDVFMRTSLMSIEPVTKAQASIDSCYQEISLPVPGCVVHGSSVSRNGLKVAYAVQSYRSYREGVVDRSWIQIHSLARGTGTRVPLAEPSFAPVWSPDGSRLLVTRGGNPEHVGYGDPRLFLIGRDGSELGLVTPDGGGDADWAASGAIAYVNDGDIWIARLGRPARRLTVRGGASPSWAPDARRLAFVRDGNIWSVRPDGRGLRQITQRGGRDPAWSPDGRRIAFLRNEQRFGLNVTSMYTLRADGKGHVRPVLISDEDDSAPKVPVWQALRP